MISNIRFISAGAGSGKTYRLTEELENALFEELAGPAGIIGTTFTNKAANELRERVRQRLIKSGKLQLANKMGQALLGTINGVCGQLLSRFAFEIGLSPELEVVPEEDGQMLFNQTLEAAITLEQVRLMNAVSSRLEIDDWKSIVKKIVDAARANNLQPNVLRACGKESAEELLSFFPKPNKENLYGAFYKAIVRAISGIEKNDDSTKGTRNYLGMLKQVQEAVNNERLTWRLWVKLSKSEPTKRSKPLAEPIKIIAIQYDRHPLLHEDIRHCCETLFNIAADSLQKYQEFKKKRGLIDFVDQEQLMLGALDNPMVLKTLKNELDLLLVDEFQDTSPIQLALFLKLASVANEVVFVGDIKQAIYGFRGSDPELMQSVLRAVKDQGGKTDIIERSWRSRPELVSYINSIFVPAFADIIPEKQVFLKAVRKEMTHETVVEHWSLSGSNKSKRASALAEGIIKLVKSGYMIFDKSSKTVRPVRFGDIAVFARINVNVANLAGAFAASGIPIKMERAGLVNTPEAFLALACLRRIADPKDTLASAEIISLSKCEDPEIWLQDRLEYLTSGRPGFYWGETEPSAFSILKVLAQQRKRLDYLTPSEALSYAINIADIRRVIIAWGPNQSRARQRLQNLDALIALAEEYEDHCGAHRRAATVVGLVSWFNDLKNAELDMQPEDPKSDAVHLSTHHGAKGLEWPIVIVTDLESGLRSGLWGMNVISESSSVDLKDPLSNRRIQYWPWPFGAQKKGIQVSYEIENSEIGQLSQKREIAEAKRLLYVSLTRARDLLILALPKKIPSGAWMNILNADWMLPTSSKLILPDKTSIRSVQTDLEVSESEEAYSSDTYKPLWFGPRQECTEKLPAIIRPSSVPEAENASVIDIQVIGKRINIKGAPEMDLVGQALHSVIAVEIIYPGNKYAKSAAQRIIDAFGLNAYIDPDHILICAQNFNSFIASTFNPVRILAEYPVEQVRKSGQVIKGWIDVLLETKEGWIIIDHKASPRPRNKWKEEALKYSGQLEAYKNAVEAATGRNVLSSWIHLPIAGGMVKVGFQSHP